MNTIEKKSLRVGKWVNREHVNEVVRNYKQDRWKYNSERLGKPDSLTGWYSIEELEEYIETIKAHGADGIRLYFAAYAQDYAEVPEYAGRQTMVMVATKNMGDDPRNNKDLYVRNGRESGILAYNGMGLCPPWCGSPTTTPPTGKADIGVTLIDNGEKGISVV